MIKRQPEAAKWARGMPGGLDNPLGARTLHLYQNGAYTLYTRLHDGSKGIRPSIQLLTRLLAADSVICDGTSLGKRLLIAA